MKLKDSRLFRQQCYIDGKWADASGQKPNMKIAVPDWLKNYGPPLSQQLQDAGFDATFDTSPGLDSQVQTGEQALGFLPFVPMHAAKPVFEDVSHGVGHGERHFVQRR